MSNFFDKFIYIDNNKINGNDSQADLLMALLFENYANYVSPDVPGPDLLCSISAPEFIDQLIRGIDKPFTAIIESQYVDRVFRDSYYMYFSNQHFQIGRFCKRVSFFSGFYNPITFANKGISNAAELSDDIIASCVITPINGGTIGRSLLNPKFFLSSHITYVRSSVFKIHICGIPIKIEAFPYYMQDRETMRCSEVTLLSLMEYYSNEYKEYRAISPSDIIQSERKHTHERVLPSRGITYHTLTKVLSEYGFAPRLYNIRAMERQNFSGMDQEDDIKRILHYYLESGIPVAVNVEPKHNLGNGHSLICIGHSGKKSPSIANSQKKYMGESLHEEYCIINSADYYTEYVVMDDNQFPYSIRDFRNLSIYSDMQITNISVPLYKRMFLEAADAYDIATEILESDHWGIKRWAEKYLKKHRTKDVVVRLFLASSRSYKFFRTQASNSVEWSLYYSHLRLPRFIWVCELYTKKGYEEKTPFGEIVLDATSASKQGISNVILINYPSRLYASNPEQDVNDIETDLITLGKSCKLSSYTMNLFPQGSRVV